SASSVCCRRETPQRLAQCLLLLAVACPVAVSQRLLSAVVLSLSESGELRDRRGGWGAGDWGLRTSAGLSGGRLVARALAGDALSEQTRDRLLKGRLHHDAISSREHDSLQLRDRSVLSLQVDWLDIEVGGAHGDDEQIAAKHLGACRAPERELR